MKNEDVDKVLQLYKSFLPNGGNFFDATHNFNFEYKEQLSILKFLEDHQLLISWGNHGKHILSSKGEEVIETHGKIEKYIEYLKEQREVDARLSKAKNQKILYDAKLSKWQAKTYWPIFFIAIIGTIYTITSLIKMMLN